METESVKIEQSNKSWLFALFVTVILIILFFVLRNSSPTTADKTFTELYFENSSSLPQKTVAGQPIIFSFVIHNLEGAPTTYPYLVYFTDLEGQKTPLANGTITLRNGDFSTTTVTHIFVASNEMGEVTVRLPALNNQSIDFLLPNDN